MTSLRWFHNDETVVFPRLVLVEGTGDTPPALSESGLVLANLTGASLAWGECVLEQPVTTTSGIMYAILVFPEGEPLEGVGTGGGAGIGLEANASGAPPFFISRDGEDWVQFDEAWTASLRFETVALARSAMPALVLGQMSEGGGESDTPAVTRTVLYSPSPNPFNPRTEIRFDLASTARVRMTIYDIRGRRVRQLIDAQVPVGRHVVSWDGVDERKRQVASGVYFALFELDGKAEDRKRMVLLK